MEIELMNVSQGYGSRLVLDHINLRVGAGIVGLLGPNGAGKSTLLRTMATVMPPRDGEISIEGSRIANERQARAVRRGIGYLPQNFGFDPGMTVHDFVTHGAWTRGLPSREWSINTREAIDRVDLSDQAKTKMRKLSGGMRQRAGIAWAVVGRPSIVLLDEPTVGLDPQQRLHFRGLIRALSGSTVILSTHLIDDIAAICDKTLIISDGQIKFDGATKELVMRGKPDSSGDTELERGYMSVLSAEGRQP